jgi:hypothetical protein
MAAAIPPDRDAYDGFQNQWREQRDGRWEIEAAYLELKSSLLGGRLRRARTPADVAQQAYALLTCYQVLRIAITDAIEAVGGIDPDRAGFTIALRAGRGDVAPAGI